jgi:uncharacterized protein (TIRG00374 family)
VIPATARRRSLVVALLLAAVLLYFAFRGVDWSELLGTLGRARPGYLALVFCAFSTSMALRSLRWRILLGAERWLPPLTVFWGTAVGYLGILFLPARAGELIRSGMIARQSGLGVGYVLATALTERVLDAVALVLILAGVLATLGQVAEWLVVVARAGAVVAVLGLAGLLVLPSFEGTAVWIVRRLPLPPRRLEQLTGLLTQFLLGLRPIRSPTRALSFFGLTALIWLIDAIAVTTCAGALGLALGLPPALLTLSAIGLASAVPSTPGMVGIYQFVGVTVVTEFGLSRAEALALVLTVQGMLYLMVIPWGLLGLWRLSAATPLEA